MPPLSSYSVTLPCSASAPLPALPLLCSLCAPAQPPPQPEALPRTPQRAQTRARRCSTTALRFRLCSTWPAALLRGAAGTDVDVHAETVAPGLSSLAAPSLPGRGGWGGGWASQDAEQGAEQGAEQDAEQGAAASSIL